MDDPVSAMMSLEVRSHEEMIRGHIVKSRDLLGFGDKMKIAEERCKSVVQEKLDVERRARASDVPGLRAELGDMETDKESLSRKVHLSEREGKMSLEMKNVLVAMVEGRNGLMGKAELIATVLPEESKGNMSYLMFADCTYNWAHHTF